MPPSTWSGSSRTTSTRGALCYGCGFALALLVTVLFAMRQLEAKLASLEYETFMRQ